MICCRCLFVLWLSATLPFAAAQQTTQKTYHDSDTGVSFDVPATWKLDTKGTRPIRIMAKTVDKKPEMEFLHEGSVFAYNAWTATDAAACVSALPFGQDSYGPSSSVTFGGTAFQEFSTEESGGCHEQTDIVDVTFAQDKCLAFERQTNASCLPLETHKGRSLAADRSSKADEQLERIMRSVRIKSSSLPVQPRTKLRFERMAEAYGHFSLEGVIDQRPINAEQEHLLQDLRVASSNLSSLKPLLGDPNPKIRTLALGAIFQREDGRDLPLIAVLLGDSAPTFPDFHESANSMPGPRPLSEMESPQTVNDVVEAMLAYWGVEHGGMPAGKDFGRPDVSASDFRDYWKHYEGRNESADWFAVRLKRATRQTTPIQPQYRTDIERVLAEMKALPEPDRSLTELYVLAPPPYCELEAEDCVVTISFLIAEERRIGSTTLMRFLEHKPVSDDPAFEYYNRANVLARDFILRHADQLLRAKDAPELLACESTVKDQGSAIDPEWSIGAALLQHGEASAILHARIDQRSGYDEDVEWVGALWRIRGKEEIPFLVEWFYGPHGSADAQREFLIHVQVSPRGDTPQLLAALVRDPRFDQTERDALIRVINLANIGRATPVIDQMSSGASWPSRYVGDCAGINAWRNSLRAAYGVAPKNDCEITELNKILRELPMHDQEVVLSSATGRGNPMTAIYDPAKVDGDKSHQSFERIQVKVNTYTSPQEALSELKRTARLKSLLPSDKPASEDGLMYVSKQHGTIMVQVGCFVLEASGGGERGFPHVLKVSESLIRQLRGDRAGISHPSEANR
jgi:hypothetical protein